MQRSTGGLRFIGPWLAAMVLGLTAGAAASASAQSLSGAALVAALRGGGYVLLMRHASSPRGRPDAAAADKDNPAGERQLDAAGRDTARAMGDALVRLRIPVGRVLSSPTYRALETARLAALPRPRPFAELGDGGQSMQADAVAAAAGWLRRTAAEPPPPGTDTVIVTHFPNIRAAFAAEAADLADGEALVLQPDGKGGTAVRGRVKIEQWPALAASVP